VTTKKQAIEFANNFSWTTADAEKAFAEIDIKEADEQALLEALVKFAGPELLRRQRLQGAQKAQVSKKSNHIKQIETEFANRVKGYEETIKKERSTFVQIIAKVYKFAKPFGLKDPWIEVLLATYEEDKKDAA
jgi:Zn-dependent metalloprotease